MLTKWWKLELTLATNFGSHTQMVTKFGGQILATKFGFVPDWSTQVRIPVGCWCRDVTFGGSSAGLGKAQPIDSSLRADWLSCFSLAWSGCRARRFPLPDRPSQVKLPVWQVDLNRFFFFIWYMQIEEFQNSWSRASDDFEIRQALGWGVTRQGCLAPLRNGGMCPSSWPASLSRVGLTLWPSRFEHWSNTSGLVVLGRYCWRLKDHWSPDHWCGMISRVQPPILAIAHIAKFGDQM